MNQMHRRIPSLLLASSRRRSLAKARAKLAAVRRLFSRLVANLNSAAIAPSSFDSDLTLNTKAGRGDPGPSDSWGTARDLIRSCTPPGAAPPCLVRHQEITGVRTSSEKKTLDKKGSIVRHDINHKAELTVAATVSDIQTSA